MTLSIEEIYTRKVKTVSPDEHLSEIKRIFNDLKVHHLPVVDSGMLRGIISDRDFIKAVSPYAGTMAETARDAATMNKRAHQIMTRQPITVGEGAFVSEAAKLMVENAVSSLPVVNETGEFKGIVTWKDLLILLVDSED